MAGTRTTVGAAALVAAVGLLAAGCGGSSSSSTTPTDTWASGVCSAITTWKTQLTSIESTVKSGGVSKDSINTAVTQAKDATDTLAKDLKKLGKPDTQAGAQAQDTVDQLSSQIETGMTTIEDAVKNVSNVSGALAAVTTVSSTLTTLQSDISAAYKTLVQLDPGGELQQAFQQAPDCASFRKSS
jgi:archaellum component FlaC